MAWFYEIRSSNNAVLKRDGGFATKTREVRGHDTVRLHAINCGRLVHLLFWLDDNGLRLGLQPHQVHSNQFDCGCK